MILTFGFYKLNTRRLVYDVLFMCKSERDLYHKFEYVLLPTLSHNHLLPSCHASLATDIFLLSLSLFLSAVLSLHWLAFIGWTLSVNLMNRSSVPLVENHWTIFMVRLYDCFNEDGIINKKQKRHSNQTIHKEYLFAFYRMQWISNDWNKYPLFEWSIWNWMNI